MTASVLTPRTRGHTVPAFARLPASPALAVADGGDMRLFELDAEVVRLGRGHAADLCFDDGTVSRRHALVLLRSDGSVEVVDEGSRAGTWVNGRRVERRVLRHGDVLRIGRTLLCFLNHGAPAVAA